MIEDLESLTDLGSELGRRARARGVFLVWRAQARAGSRVVVRAGRVEDTSSTSSSGHAVQVLTGCGRTALASRDDFRPEAALTLLERAIGAAERSAALGVESAEIPPLPPTVDRCVPPAAASFGEPDLAAVGRRLVELEDAVRERVPGPALRIAYEADLDVWRIVRSDGADVLFAMPRCTLRLAATGRTGAAAHAVAASVSSPGPRLPWEDERLKLFMARAVRAARLARDLPDAVPHPAGSFPLVIDYALAKGLAHEAFGHAAEADGYRSSILARGGRFRAGQAVGASHVSIVDEPIPDDHAWQPYSANGVRRERAVIVDRGRLKDGLSDPWSAGPGGVRLTGAERAASFRDPPLPRMTNIRIEVAEPLDAPGGFEDYGQEEVRELLRSAGVLARHPRVVFLSGYSGGQVNSVTGDFVFNCRAIYELSRDGVRLHKPAIFSGSMFGALGAIREAFGPLRLDAIGTCGKWGQSVPSSGGSHYFLVLEPHPDVRLGGR